jgi:Tol biopolymer transport system component
MITIRKTRNKFNNCSTSLAVPALAAVLLLTSAWAIQNSDQLEVELKAAMHKELVDGDLEGAIADYKSLVSRAGTDRTLAAKALLQMGKCYEKLGRDEARKAYERLVRDYADQHDQAGEAQSRLAAMEKPAGDSMESTFATRMVWEGADGVFGNAVSPDGRYITYVDWESGNLAVRDLKANTSRLLTNEGTWEEPSQVAYSSRWSPDGKQIAYHWYKGSEPQLRVLSLDDPLPRILFRDNSEGAWLETLDWSQDGETILVWIGADGRPNQLALIPIKGGSPQVIRTFELMMSAGGGLFSPDGRFIAYSRTPGKVTARDIYIMDVNGGGETPLIQHPADDYLFGWSPDGKWILFLSDRSGTPDFWAIRVANGKTQGAPVMVKRAVGRVTELGFAKDESFYYADVKVARDIYRAEIDFENARVLAPAEKAIVRYEGSNMWPSYSPDGKWLAYVSRRGGVVFPTNSGNALCIHSLESDTERVFMEEFAKLGVRSVVAPEWASDSRSLVVGGLQVVGTGRELYQVSLDTGKVSPVLETPPDTQIINHELSAEGQRLFYVRDDRNRKLRQILVRDLLTGEERELYRASSGDEEPVGIALSPDGERLAMLSANRKILSVMPSGGGNPRVIYQFDQSWNRTKPEWTRDGKYLLISSVGLEECTLYRISVENGRSQEIKLHKSLWGLFTAHPDGRQIAFTSMLNADSDADVWVMQNFLPQ